MNSDEPIAEELRAVPMPPELVPPQGYIDEALRRRARSRSYRTVAAVLAVIGMMAGATAVMGGSGGGADPAQSPEWTSSPYTEPNLPRPGGGPLVVESFTAGPDRHYLLDRDTGVYRSVPFRAQVSPDQGHVAVTDGVAYGFADRSDYLTHGADAVSWPAGLPGYSAFFGGLGGLMTWSPDGTRFQLPPVVAEDPPRIVEFVAYDVTTAAFTRTPAPADVDVSHAIWAADSEGYAVLEKRQGARPALRSLAVDGSLGPRTEIDGDHPVLAGFSPDGRYLLYYSSPDEDDRRVRVMEVEEGETVLSMKIDDADVRRTIVGWADSTTVLCQEWMNEPGVWERIAVPDGTVDRGDAAWPNDLEIGGIGPSSALPPEAADLGF
ncbi:hypothetical protein AB0I28_14065 [Phytomonospora sp. NPDC050363]|uniref:hypothetical protein n=1 Tax=Phytomonospora sp. NPDC050363 TaxID=3155642 RepID=UPI00340EB7EA